MQKATRCWNWNDNDNEVMFIVEGLAVNGPVGQTLTITGTGTITMTGTGINHRSHKSSQIKF
jgi:hypothetical protein